MSESAINRRKSKLFLTGISPVFNTHNEVIRKKLKSGKFPQTKTGIIKMIGMTFYFGSIVSWTVLSKECNNVEVVYSFISSISLAFLGQLALFLIFSFGKTVRNPPFWIYGDIIFNILFPICTIVTSVIFMKTCSKHKKFDQKLSEVLALCGAGISVCSCASLFLMYRFIEDPEENTALPRRAAVKDPRKSIFA